MHTIGFLVNPIAGMGGAVGLKGTDGLEDEAIRRGAHRISGLRAENTLRLIKDIPFFFLTCAGAMGEDALVRVGISSYQVVYHGPITTEAEDTKKACHAFMACGAEIILFCGGDGTARDIYDITGDTIPIFGIPAGVKMYSAVFATSPEAAAGILQEWKSSSSLHLKDAEVMDINEEAYRKGELRAELHGYAKSPYLPGLIQGAKQVFEDQDEERAKKAIGRFIAEVMKGTPEILYILGPGSTTGAIAREIGIDKTLLGFDAIRNEKLIGADLNEREILLLLSEKEPARLIVSIIGAQGSVLGRGTQQVSPRVLREIGIDQVIVVATPHKLAATPLLFIDTGDRDIDASFGEYISVISGYHVAQRKKLVTPQEFVTKKD